MMDAGIYNTEYFSGAQVSVYIGDVWIDEITSISYSVQQSRAPLYGYADTYFRDVAKGKVLVQGQFTINFKESGYLWLVLQRYKTMLHSFDASYINSFGDSGTAGRENIEAIQSIIQNDKSYMSQFDRNNYLQALASQTGFIRHPGAQRSTSGSAASLGGFSEFKRRDTAGTASENAFETFEDAVWGESQDFLDNANRRADDADLNPFDIYLTFGDFAADNNVNHTIHKLSDVYIIGSSREIVIDGTPIQEAYSFICRNLV